MTTPPRQRFAEPAADSGLTHVLMWLIDHHPDPLNRNLGTRPCSICGCECWLMPKTAVYLAMNPNVPALCCHCNEVVGHMVEHFLPNHEFVSRDVPDLARQGVFN